MTLAERFGEHVRSLRLARNWSQADLAERMTEAGSPLHQTQVGKVETASRPVDLDEVAALMQVLGASVADVFRDATAPDWYGDGYRAGYQDGVAAARDATRVALDRIGAPGPSRPQGVDAPEESTP